MFHVDVVHVGNIVISDMIVAHDHSRHERRPTPIVHCVLGSWFGDIAICAHCRNACSLDYDRRIPFGSVDAVNQICAAKENPSHMKTLLTLGKFQWDYSTGF